MLGRGGVVKLSKRPPEVRERVPGTGIEVWEVVKVWLEVDRDWRALRANFAWLSEEQLRAALDFAFAHDAPILARIRQDYRHVPPEYADDLPEVPERLIP
jgi:uncharacterized protein (DUF433 family)